jgi:hypothetical protein
VVIRRDILVGLTAILEAIAALTGRVITISTVVQSLFNLGKQIYEVLHPPAGPIDFNTMQTQVASIQAHVLDPTYGLQAIEAEISANQTAVLAAIAALPATGDTVVLPGTFPPGWVIGAGDAVWGWQVPTSNNVAYSFLTLAGWGAQQRGFPQTNEETPFATALWKVCGTWGEDGVSDPNANTTFDLDVTTILSSDATSADWLNRVAPTAGWLSPLANGCLALEDIDGGNWQWYVDLPIDKWLQLKANLGLTNTGKGPPIWQGLANVTLGASTALTNGLMLTGPMDGVIVTILSAPPGKAKFAYGLVTAYQHLAALSFTDDDAHQEGFQPVQFEVGIYCPTTMVTAAGVIFRVDPAVTGTVVPWTNN